MNDQSGGRNRRLGFATRAIHHGYDPRDSEGALTPPVYMTSTYAFTSAEEGGAILRARPAAMSMGGPRTPLRTCWNAAWPNWKAAKQPW